MRKATLKTKTSRKARRLSSNSAKISKRRDISTTEIKKLFKNIKDFGLDLVRGVDLDGVILKSDGSKEMGPEPSRDSDQMKEWCLLKSPTRLKREMLEAEIRSKRKFEEGAPWMVFIIDYDLLVHAGVKPVELIYPKTKNGSRDKKSAKATNKIKPKTK